MSVNTSSALHYQRYRFFCIYLETPWLIHMVSSPPTIVSAKSVSSLDSAHPFPTA
jgi:hypothetical protein